MKKVLLFIALFICGMQLTYASYCQEEYDKINSMKIELANVQESYLNGEKIKEMKAQYAGSPYLDGMIRTYYQEGADKEALMLVQINKQIAIYQTCLSESKAQAERNLEQAKQNLEQSKQKEQADKTRKFLEYCYSINGVMNSDYTGCSCTIGTSFDANNGKCTSPNITSTTSNGSTQNSKRINTQKTKLQLIKENNAKRLQLLREKRKNNS